MKKKRSGYMAVLALLALGAAGNGTVRTAAEETPAVIDISDTFELPVVQI